MPTLSLIDGGFLGSWLMAFTLAVHRAVVLIDPRGYFFDRPANGVRPCGRGLSQTRVLRKIL